MKIAPIAACDLNMTIGREGGLPWRLPADLRHFKQTTMGKAMIMGRRTFQSLPGPLEGRTNIVLTRRTDFDPSGVEVVHWVDQALAAARRSRPEAGEVMVLGGAQVYETMLPRADILYLTVIHDRFEGDTFLPAFDIDQWAVESTDHHEPDAHNRYPYSFFELRRVDDKPLRVDPQTSAGQLAAVLADR